MKKRLMICAFAAVALLGTATAAMLRAPSTQLSAGNRCYALVAGVPHRGRRK